MNLPIDKKTIGFLIGAVSGLTGISGGAYAVGNTLFADAKAFEVHKQGAEKDISRNTTELKEQRKILEDIRDRTVRIEENTKPRRGRRR